MDDWNILLESTDDGFTVATVLEFPDCQIRDETKQGAVEKVQKLLQKRLPKLQSILSNCYNLPFFLFGDSCC